MRRRSLLFFIPVLLLCSWAGADLTREEQLRLNAAETMIEEGERMIEEGRRMASVRDGRSPIDGAYIDRSGVRESGQQRIEAGRRKVRQGEQLKQALLPKAVPPAESDKAPVESAGHGGMDSPDSHDALRYVTWTDREGRQIRAAFQGLFDDEARLLREDGQTFSLPLARLSDRDASRARILAQGLSLDAEGYFKAVRHGNEAILRAYALAGFRADEAVLSALLVRAAVLPDLDACRLLIRQGGNINAADQSGQLPLHAAVRAGSPEAVRLLLEIGAEPDQRDPGTGLTALESALTQSNRAVLKLVRERSAAPTPAVAFALEAYDHESVGPLTIPVVSALTQLDERSAFDPDDPKHAARMHIWLGGGDLSPESFYRALEQNDMLQLERYLQAGIMDELDFSAKSPLWRVVWAVSSEKHRDYLLEAAGIDEEGRLLLQGRCMDLTPIKEHAQRLSEPKTRMNVKPVREPNHKDWSGATQAQREIYDYMRTKYPELGRPDLSGYQPTVQNAQENLVDEALLRQILQAHQPQRGGQGAPINWDPEPLPGMPGSSCSACRGEGVCSSCNGAGGRTMYGPSNPYGEFVRCSSCNGTGRCQYCRGTGKW